MEEWRDVVGFEKRYQVSNRGRVRSMPRVEVFTSRWGGLADRRHKGKFLKASANPDGYMRVVLYGPDGRRQVHVHVLVAEAWLGPRPPEMVVCHKNDVKSDNHLDNLYYGSHSQNMLDAVRNGLNWQAAKTQCDNGHPFDTANTYIRGGQRRQCRRCNRDATRRRRERVT